MSWHFKNLATSRFLRTWEKMVGAMVPLPLQFSHLRRLMCSMAVRVNSPDGPVPPLVTGTFAGADFCFSMLGEASDKLSSASIADLTAQMDEAQNQNKKSDGGRFEFIKSILSKLPLGGSNGDTTVNDDLDQINQKKKAFDLDVSLTFIFD